MSSPTLSSRTLSIFGTIGGSSVTEDRPDKGDPDEVTFIFNRDIYNFLLLLYAIPTEKGKKGETPLSQLTPIQKQYIYSITLFSYIVQMIGILFFLFNWSSYSWIKSSELDVTNCTPINAGSNDNVDVNGTTIDDQRCTFTQDTWPGWQPIDAEVIAAKFIATLMVIAFTLSDIVSVPRLITLFILSSSKTVLRVMTFVLCISQLIVVATALGRIFQIIYNQDSVIDVLTVGISFIILMEIDNKCFELVSHLNIYGDKVFHRTIKKSDLKNTVYSCVDPLTYDLIVIYTSIIVTVAITILNTFCMRDGGDRFVYRATIIICSFAGVVFFVVPFIFICKKVTNKC